MLFNSYVFIFLYLPITLGLFFWLGHRRHYGIAMGWLVVASLFFYAWWSPVYLWLIAVSMLFNYWVGVFLGRWAGTAKSRSKRLLWFGVTVNLSLLGYYKYANFFLANIEALFGVEYALGTIVLPLGISFFTFTQIAYLVDAYRGEAREYSFVHYALFVTYFPHLIAGPVLHHKEMMPQFAKPSIYLFSPAMFGAGLTYFVMGLFKKVVIADTIAVYAGPIFSAAHQGSAITGAEAWAGALAYTFQLYFDFSGYSDMAVGLAMMMGVRLPLNFDSPYKAVNISDFWRRWHMTLSRFLRDYLYIALGGNRRGDVRRYVNLLLTMLLGGLWHGAGWTFVIWGALHGCYLVVNHAWQALRAKLGQDLHRSSPWGRAASRLLTFLAVVVGWVFFRAHDWQSAVAMLQAMASFDSGSFGAQYSAFVTDSRVGRWLALGGLYLAPELLLGGLIALLFAICAWAPNTQQLMWKTYRDMDSERVEKTADSMIVWNPTKCWGLLIAAAAAWAILGLTSVSEFLYFQF